MWHESVSSKILLRPLPYSCPFGFKNLDLIFILKIELNWSQEVLTF